MYHRTKIYDDVTPYSYFLNAILPRKERQACSGGLTKSLVEKGTVSPDKPPGTAASGLTHNDDIIVGELGRNSKI